MFKHQGPASQSSLNTNYYWRQVVESFTERSLSFSGDGLPAVAGIAAAIKPNKAGDYVCGLWKDNFMPLLL